jgi:hypothetical protein
MFGRPGGVEGIDNDFVAKSDDNIGATDIPHDRRCLFANFLRG